LKARVYITIDDYSGFSVSQVPGVNQDLVVNSAILTNDLFDKINHQYFVSCARYSILNSETDNTMFMERKSLDNHISQNEFDRRVNTKRKYSF
jgi:hypothetical protein